MTDTPSAQLEHYVSTQPGSIGIIRLVDGKEVSEHIQGVGTYFSISPEDRALNSLRCKVPALDPFRTEMFVRVTPEEFEARAMAPKRTGAPQTEASPYVVDRDSVERAQAMHQGPVEATGPVASPEPVTAVDGGGIVQPPAPTASKEKDANGLYPDMVELLAIRRLAEFADAVGKLGPEDVMRLKETADITGTSRTKQQVIVEAVANATRIGAPGGELESVEELPADAVPPIVPGDTGERTTVPEAARKTGAVGGDSPAGPVQQAPGTVTEVKTERGRVDTGGNISGVVPGTGAEWGEADLYGNPEAVINGGLTEGVGVTDGPLSGPGDEG